MENNRILSYVMSEKLTEEDLTNVSAAGMTMHSVYTYRHGAQDTYIEGD